MKLHFNEAVIVNDKYGFYNNAEGKIVDYKIQHDEGPLIMYMYKVIFWDDIEKWFEEDELESAEISKE